MDANKQNAELRIKNAECRMQNAECRMQNAELPTEDCQLRTVTIDRITIRLIIIIASLFLSGFSFSQDLKKKISLNMKNVPLIDVINEISNIGQITFSYSSQLIPVNKKITIKAKNKTIKEILDEVFTKNGIEYSIVENLIVLKPQKTNVSQNVEVNPKEKTKYTISGYLKDKASGEVLIGASVYSKSDFVGTTTNAYGFYSFTLQEGTYDIVYSFIGYKPVIQTTEFKKNIIFSVDLETAKFEIKPVEIVANDKETEMRENQFSAMKLSPRTINQLPGFVGDVDIIKSLQAIPGIKSYGDGSALFYVRGGNSDQNLLMVDEAPIYNPSHLFGFFSAIAPDAIKDVEAYKGDFPASFGGRLSSVIDIKTKDGNMKKLGFSGSIGPYTSNISFEGPIIKNKSSFFISGRRSNLNWLLGKKNNRTLKINFFDINGKLNFKLNNNNRFFLTLYKGNDDFSRVIPTSAVKTFGISWDNILGTLRWNHIFNNKLFSNTTIYSSQYNYYLYISREQNDYWNSSISNSTIKTDFTYYLNPKNTIKTGLELNSHNTNPGNIHFSDDAIQRYIPAVPKYSSRQFDFYLSNEQKLSKKFSLRYGLRLPVWQNIGATTIYYFNVNYQVMDTLQIGEKSVYSTFVCPEPRINITYSINNNSSLKASYNRNTQFIQILSNSTSPFTSLEVWVPSGPNIKPQKADQYALGYFQGIDKSKLVFSMETFYKQFYNQIDYADHANMLFNPLIEGELRFGKAWAYGMEFMLRKPEGKFTGWVGYTYSRTFKQINGINNDQAFPASYDRPHNICMNLSYNSNKRWSFSASWVFVSGGAISTPVSFYYYNGYTVPVYGDKNNDRLPDYHRMDIAITYKLNKPERRYQHSLTLTLYNAYGRKNPFSVNFNKIMDDNGKFYVPSNLDGNYELVPTSIYVAGLIPSVTYNFKF